MSFACNGSEVTAVKPEVATFAQEIPLPPGNQPDEVGISVDATVRPSEVDPNSSDTRLLGLRLLSIEVK